MLSIEPGLRASGLWTLTGDEWFFPGHFPGRPTTPGVLMLEVVAQWVPSRCSADAKYAGRLPLFGGVENARFRRQVLPGDTVLLECEMTRLSARGGKGHGRATRRRAGGRRRRDLLFILADALVKIATWNVNSLTARWPRVEAWLERPGTRRGADPRDQADRREVPLRTARAPRLRLRALRTGPVERRRDPLASRTRGRDAGLRRRRPRGAHHRGDVCGRCGSTRATCPTVARSTIRTTTTSCTGSTKLRDSRRDRDRDQPLIVGGDFNVAPTDLDCYDPSAFVGATHVSEPERRALRGARRRGAHRPDESAASGRAVLHVVGLPQRLLSPGLGTAHRPALRRRDAARPGDARATWTARPERARSRRTTRRSSGSSRSNSVPWAASPR